MPDLLLYDYPGSICSQMARLALVEKCLPFQRQTIDIMNTSEQFESWYIALNPAAVVPTLKDGEAIVTDTIRIVNHINQYPGADLTLGDAPDVQDWLRRIMALHYGVLLYSGHLDADRTSPTMISRAANLRKMAEDRPELAEVMAKTHRWQYPDASHAKRPGSGGRTVRLGAGAGGGHGRSPCHQCLPER